MVTHARIPFSDLVFLEDNPRTRTPDGLRRMADDIQADPTFFDNRPVLVNLTSGRYQVYAGDLRAHAAHDVLGWSDIPCNIEQDVPDATMRRRAIQDNIHRESWDIQVLNDSWLDIDFEGIGMDAEDWIINGKIDPNQLDTEFTLPNGDRAPFQQMTFTLADEQAKAIQQKIMDVKKTEGFKYLETFGNENGNGNALYLLVMNGKG